MVHFFKELIYTELEALAAQVGLCRPKTWQYAAEGLGWNYNFRIRSTKWWRHIFVTDYSFSCQCQCQWGWQTVIVIPELSGFISQLLLMSGSVETYAAQQTHHGLTSQRFPFVTQSYKMHLLAVHNQHNNCALETKNDVIAIISRVQSSCITPYFLIWCVGGWSFSAKIEVI
jgi:hypothetical protein